jgi:Type IV secretory pathway, TrbL components
MKTTTAYIKYILLAITIIALHSVAWGQTQVSSLTPVTSSTSTTFTVPTGVYALVLEAWGAGGGGGVADNTGGRTAGGGGGGAYAKSIISVTPGDVLNITVGAGGSGGSGANAGGSSFVSLSGNNLVLAVGGGGVANNSTAGGSGGQASACIGNIITNSGGNGGNAYPTAGGNAGAGGGGGAAGSTGPGKNGIDGNNDSNNGSAGNGGAATADYGGAGGNGVGDGGVGLGGSNYGGGGGGGKRALISFSGNNGGNGAGGFVRISFPTPPEIAINGNEVCQGDALTLTATSPHPALASNGWEWIQGSSGSGTYTNSPSFTTENLAPGIYTYKVRVHYGDVYWPTNSTIRPVLHDDSPNTVTFTIKPKPVVTAKTTTICSGSGFSLTPGDILPDIVPSGTIYSWSAPTHTNVTGMAAGTNSSNISGTALTNTTNVVQNVVYTVTPKAGDCTGDPFTVTVTVNPKPNIIDKTETICSGETFSVIPENDTNGDIVPAGTTYTWSAPTTPSEVTGKAAGSGSSISGTLTNTTNTVQTVEYTVTPTSGSCTGNTFTVTVTVNPKPFIGNKTTAICSGDGFTIPLVNGTDGDIIPTGTTYTWSAPTHTNVTGMTAGNNLPNISGTALTNTSNATQQVIYTVTSSTASCPGNTFEVTVTVNPKPVIDGKTATICSDGTFTIPGTDFASDYVPIGTTYSWAEPVNANVTGMAAGTNSGSISGTLTNNTNTVQTVTYTVIPSVGTCTGASFPVVVTVNPKPIIGNQITTICSGDDFNLNPSGVSGTTYTWTVHTPNVDIEGGDGGEGENTINGRLTNITVTGLPRDIVYTVTPKAGDCVGNSFMLTITVNPKPYVGNITLTPTTYCIGEDLVFPSVPDITSTNIIDDGWLLGGVEITDPYVLTYVDNGKKLKYFVENDCGMTYSNEIEIEVIVTEITSITPNFGPTTGGIYTSDPANPINPAGIVTIKGRGFLTVTNIFFGTVAATTFTVIDDETIECVPPAYPVSGFVNVAVTSDCGTDVLNNGYQYEGINITEVTPNYAPVTGGTTVIIKGTGLLAAGGYTAGDVWVKLCGVEATIVSATDEEIECITGKSDYSLFNSIEIFNGLESREFPKHFTYYPVEFIVNGVWSEPYNWKTQTDDRILPYPGARVHIKANCVQDIDLEIGTLYPVRPRDAFFLTYENMDSITVYPKKAYTIDKDKTLDAEVFTLKDDASFLNYGNMQVEEQNLEHSLAQGRNWYVSNPIDLTLTPQTIDAAFGTGTLSSWRVEWYNEFANNWQKVPSGSDLTTGRGYTVYSDTEDISVKFSGKYNDGDMNSPTLTRGAHSKQGFNLVGNPFPSYWRWTEIAASTANVYSTIWYRTVVDGNYEFWSYNAAGNVEVAPGGWEDGTPTGSYMLGYIPPMQAFWVRVMDGQSSGTINFLDRYRSHADHPSNILKSKGQESQNADERQMIRIVVNSNKNIDETLIYADSRAQNGFDNYDGDKWFTGTGAEIFTLPIAENRELVINGLPEIVDGIEIPLGFVSNEGGSFSFSAKEIINLDNLDVLLRDKWRNVEFNLVNDGVYNFTSGSEVNTERFSIVFRASVPSDINTNYSKDSKLLAYSNNNEIVATYSNPNNDNVEVTVYDVLGRSVAVQTIVANQSVVINGKFTKGIYTLRAENKTTKVVVQ